jgi:hypothetical protein
METYRRIGVSAFAKHHQFRRDLLVIVAVPKSSLPRRRYAHTPTRRHASPSRRPILSATIYLLFRGQDTSARYDSDATHRITSSIRRYAAVDTESPIPVPSAMYAARHAGHFGTSARMTPGAIHPAMPRQRRANPGRCGSLSNVRALIVSRSEPFGATSQQR